MKKLILLIVVFTSNYVYSLDNCDTIPYLGNCLSLKTNTNIFYFELKNDTLTMNGEMEGNCCGYNFLLYHITDDSIIMNREHTGDFCDCLCMFEINFRFDDITSDSVRVIIHPNILDTLIYAQPLRVFDNLAINNGKVFYYPNPFSTSLTIEFANPHFNNFTFELFDNKGRRVKFINNIRTNQLIINKNNLENGVYIFQLSSCDNHIYRGKIIVN